jgi:hypothetical protein
VCADSVECPVRAGSKGRGAQDNGGRRANPYLVGIVVEEGSSVLVKGGAALGLGAAILLTAAGVGAAVAVEPQAQPAPVQQPPTGARVVTVLDAPRVNLPAPTSTTTTTPPAPLGGSASATITVTLTHPY